MNRCRWCNTVMDIKNDGLTITTYRCPTCHAEEGYGIEKPPDPDRLRDYSEELGELADALESDHPLAKRLRE